MMRDDFSRLSFFILMDKRREAARRPDPGAADCLLQASAVFAQLRAVVPRMPQMQDAGGKPPVFAAQPGAQETNDEIGIFQSPADKGIVEAIDAVEVLARDRKIARLGAAPTDAVQLAQGPKGQMHGRCQTIDAAVQSLPNQIAEIP